VSVPHSSFVLTPNSETDNPIATGQVGQIELLRSLIGERAISLIPRLTVKKFHPR
jgi:hypothetical protein